MKLAETVEGLDQALGYLRTAQREADTLFPADDEVDQAPPEITRLRASIEEALLYVEDVRKELMDERDRSQTLSSDTNP